MLYKNNTDNKGASYGSHENYLMRRSTPFADIVRHLTPFFVSRQVVCGAGRVGIGQDGRTDGFQISQRADYFEVEVGLETTLKRPIINTRDEPHADPGRYRRLHVIIGDANLAEVSTYLKVGTTSLVLSMIEARYLSAELSVRRPVQSLHEVSHDPALDHLLELADGRTLTAVQLQWEYHRLASAYVADRLGDDADAADPRRARPLGSPCWTGSSATRWSAARELDWVAKLQLLEQYRDRDGLAWDDAKLALIDLQYADLRPQKGLYHRLLRLGRMETAGLRAGGGGRDARAAARHPRLLPRPLPRQVPRRVAAASWDSVIFDLPGHESLQRVPTIDPLRGSGPRGRPDRGM